MSSVQSGYKEKKCMHTHTHTQKKGGEEECHDQPTYRKPNETHILFFHFPIMYLTENSHLLKHVCDTVLRDNSNSLHLAESSFGRTSLISQQKYYFM